MLFFIYDLLFYFLTDINANEATESPAKDVDGTIQEEISREQEREQKLDLEPVLNSVPQNESAGNTSCTLNNF